MQLCILCHRLKYFLEHRTIGIITLSYTSIIFSTTRLKIVFIYNNFRNMGPKIVYKNYNYTIPTLQNFLATRPTSVYFYS